MIKQNSFKITPFSGFGQHKKLGHRMSFSSEIFDAIPNVIETVLANNVDRAFDMKNMLEGYSGASE